MGSPCWWHYGLIGGVTLLFATLVKAVGVVIGGGVARVDWTEAVGFLAAIFGMGFVCGVVVWAGRGLSRRFGLIGDAVLGMIVTL